MLDEKIVIEKMSERGFIETSRSMDKDKIVSMFFISKPTYKSEVLDTPSIGCNVFLESEEFKLEYIVPCSINVLTSNRCNSFMNDKYFDNLHSTLEKQARVLYHYFGKR